MSYRFAMYVIAEMACSHEGNPALAKTIIDGAGKAGANAIQFQIWKLSDYAAPTLPNYAVLQKLELSFDAWKELHSYSKKHYPAMDVIACVSESASIALAEELNVEAYKIHAGDLTNPSFITEVAKTGKRIDLAVGASTKEEVAQAIGWITKTSPSGIWLMYGYQNFPTRTDDVHLRHMLQLAEDFGLPVGYQDHSGGGTLDAFTLPAAALGMGIGIQEKHITHDRAKKGIDHEAALNPDEFTSFVEMCRTIEAAKGKKEWIPFSADQEKYRTYARKSIVAAEDISAGTAVTEERVAFMRTSPIGLPPSALEKVLGRTLKTPLKRYQGVTEEDLA